MNKYQEALDCVFNTIYGHKAFYKELKQFREKYKQYPEDVLQELVDKLIPKKVKVWSFVNARGKYIDVYYCGSCNQSIDRIKYENHCFNCGQALDWSE
jgi:hypothetical protein